MIARLGFLVFIITLGIGITGFVTQPVEGNINSENNILMNCRYGIGSPMGNYDYDLVSLGIGGYIDWRYDSSPILPNNTDYIRMFRVADIYDRYTKAYEDLDKIVLAHTGAYYIIGNEPDTIYEDQDGVLPEVYAERFYNLATKIRTLDPNAKIGFGTIVQATPIRLRYLDKAWKKLVLLSGSSQAASALIDFWAIHAFIMNEIPGEWGVGVPPGFENDYQDAVKIDNLDDTHSIELFKSRVISFRKWMSEKGERNKPLWISEYGSLLPPIDPPVGPNYANVSDRDTADYMIKTFEFLRSAKDTSYGLPSDHYKLTQRWFWYSLDDYRYKFGGSLFDPLLKTRTVVGDEFVNVVQKEKAGPDLYFINTIVNPINYQNDSVPTDYRIDFVISNSGSAYSPQGTISIYQDDIGEDNLVTTQFGSVPGCGQNKIVFSVWLNNLIPKKTSWLIAKINITGDLNEEDNSAWFFISRPP
jgi:hypothetical protein